MDPCQAPLEAPDDLLSTGAVDHDADEHTGEVDNIDIDNAGESTGLNDDMTSDVDKQHRSGGEYQTHGGNRHR